MTALGRLLASNDNWRDTQQAEIQATGAAPTNTLESAIVRTLNPGSYTAILRGKNAGTGIGLVEIYDLSPTANSTLANLSTRGLVGTGENVMIAGFIVGNGDKPILALRAVGPSLTNQGIAGALQDPTLELRDNNGALIASNDNWKTRRTAPLPHVELRRAMIVNQRSSDRSRPATTPQSCAAKTTPPASRSSKPIGFSNDRRID